MDLSSPGVDPLDLGSTPDGQAAGTIEDRYASALRSIADDPSIETVVIARS